MSGRDRGARLRLFVALVPPPEALEHLDAFLEPRRAAAPFRWSAAEQVHLTLAFCPAAPERVLDDLVEALALAAARRTPLRARVAGGGAFPDPLTARVLWAGLDLDDDARAELDRLAAGVRGAASHVGAAPEGQRFRPHLTVGRLGAPAGVLDWVRLLDTYAGPAWTADEVALLSSHLGEGPRGRPRHEVLATLPLGG
ncbi:RNA 2',3'-cyclic phosphodiesterase [Nocardioides sp. Leaf285]|uniref:RNA 2',3'-cyclic phosphodiesterase n=1 Tax=Nocardioides sp. Leaf285 TaxID=1736322 RepID=UPI000A56D986|nr:RNA 2',3'-cyclic phosphodiesterase [Nocardioides sp. Leaf285]